MPLTFLVLKNIIADDKYNFSRFFSLGPFDSLVPDRIVSLLDRGFSGPYKLVDEYEVFELGNDYRADQSLTAI
nr:hypothetical protein [uncultured Undibacterium sp.]